jgi:hypothetical protein
MFKRTEQFIEDYKGLAKAETIDEKALLEEMEQEVLEGGNFEAKTYGDYEMKSSESKDGKPHVFKFETIRYFDEDEDLEEIIEYKGVN